MRDFYCYKIDVGIGNLRDLQSAVVISINIFQYFFFFQQQSRGKEDPLTAAIHVGDLVRLKENAVYYDGTAIPDWVRARAWYVKSISGSRAVIDRDEQNTHAICSPVDITYLSLVQSKDSEKNQQFPYLVKVTVSVLNIRSGPGTDQAKTGKITDYGVYTIEEEADGPGAEKWGKLKSGAGWIALDYTKKV